MKLLDLPSGLSLMSVEILLSMQVLVLEANSVESSEGVATAERSEKSK